MVIFYLTQLALLITHITAYKEHFINMGFTFAVTLACKKLLKSMDQKDKASLLGLAGNSLVLMYFISYLCAVKTNGTQNALRPELNFKKELDIEDIQGVFDGVSKQFKIR